MLNHPHTLINTRFFLEQSRIISQQMTIRHDERSSKTRTERLVSCERKTVFKTSPKILSSNLLFDKGKNNYSSLKIVQLNYDGL